MKRFKKTLATVLSFLMCFTLFSNVAYAHGTETDPEDSSIEIIYSDDSISEDNLEISGMNDDIVAIDAADVDDILETDSADIFEETGIEGDENEIISDDFDVEEIDEETVDDNEDSDSLETTDEEEYSDSMDTVDDNNNPDSLESFDGILQEDSLDETLHEDSFDEDTVIEIVTEEITDTDDVFLSETENGVAINANNFPDDIFRQYVSDNFDTIISDGVLDEDEVLYATYIDVSCMEINSLEGIEHLDFLEILYCNDNYLTSLDVSKNINLKVLFCGNNLLTELDVSNNILLDSLSFQNNQINDIDLKTNTSLSSLDCRNNNLSSLDTSNNLNLKILYCDCNQLTSLDVSMNSMLESVWCDSNQISSFEANSNIYLISITGNKLSNFDANKYIELRQLFCRGNQLSQLDVSALKHLEWLDCSDNQLTELDVSKNEELLNLNCQINNISSLIMGQNHLLENIYCYDNNFINLDLSNCNFDISSMDYLIEKNGWNNASYQIYKYEDNIKIECDENVNIIFYEGFYFTKQPENSNANIGDNVVFEVEAEGATSYKWFYYDEYYDNWLELDEKNGITGVNTSKLSVLLNDDNVQLFFRCEIRNVSGKILSSKAVQNKVNIEINDENFPDDIFRQYVSDNFDTNICDGLLDNEEISSIINVEVSQMNIGSLSGIEFFTELVSLNCAYNNLTNLDISNNTKLSKLYCFYNNLSYLDIKNNTDLEYLNCSNNQLTYLDISNNEALNVLYCDDNYLANIDLSNQPYLQEFGCQRNQLTELDVCNNTILRTLVCGWNSISNLDLGNNPFLEDLGCDNNELQELDLTNNKYLYIVSCENNNISELKIYGGEYLKYICCNYNNLSELDLSNCINIKEIACRFNRIKKLDLSQNIYLEELSCESNSIEELDISKNVRLEELYCLQNPIKKIDISDCPILVDLFLNGTKLITEISYADNSSFKCLEYYNWNDYNQIVLAVDEDDSIFAFDTPGDLVVKIDEDNFPDDNFRLYLNKCDGYPDGWLSKQEIEQIKKLDLTYYNIGYLNISSLEGIEYLTALNYLDCSYQSINHLDISHNTELKYLNCIGTGIRILDISSCEQLIQLLNHYNDYYGYYYIAEDNCLITGNILLVYPGSGTDNIIVEINEETFPDKYFRENVVRGYDIDEDGNLSEAEIKSINSINLYVYSEYNDCRTIKGIEYFTSLKTLYIYGSSPSITEIDLSKNTELKSFTCQYCTNLHNVDISQNTKLTNLSLQGCSNLHDIDISNNTELTELSLYWCKSLEKIDISNNRKLTSLNCVKSNLKELDISDCPNLVGIISASNYSDNSDGYYYSAYNEFGRNVSLSVGNNTKLIYLKEGEFGPEITEINNSVFPDESFRNLVSRFDQNSDNVLSEKEIEAINAINLNGKMVTSLKGLEILTSLKELRVAECQLAELDISQNKDLEILDCGGNNLSDLDISNNKLAKLVCRDNNITSLDLNDNNSLKILNCSGNSLGKLDISKTSIMILNCSNCNLDELTCNNRIYALNCSKNNLSAINNLSFDNTNYYGYTSYDYYLEGYSQGENFNGCTLNASDNGFSELDVSQYDDLYDLNCSNNQISELNLDNLKQLYMLDCSNNSLTKIDINYNTNLYSLDCSFNEIASIDIANGLGWLVCTDNQLTELDASKISYGVACQNNKIETLILGESGFYIRCFNNKISTLDVSNSPIKKYVYASSKDGKTLYSDSIMGDDWTVDDPTVFSYLIVDEAVNVIPITKKYAIIFYLYESPASAARGDSVDVDSDYTLPNCEFAAPTGYLFDKWKVNIGDNDAVYKNPGDVIKITANTKVYAVWKAKTDIAYKVEHYKQGLDGEYTASPEVENLTGTTDAEIQPALKNYDGFTAPDVQTVTIKADGSLVVKYYYSRNNYNLTWDYDGGTASGEYTIGVLKYETPITAPTLTRDGYTFDGWDVSVPETMPAKDLTIKAKWKVINGISYKVEHYKQDFDGKYTASPEVEEFTGAAGESVKPSLKSYEGFVAPAEQLVTIKADGSLVVKYYYTRNSYKLIWNFDGGKASGNYTSGNVKYGASITEPTLTKTGYSFDGWDVSVPSTMPAKDLTIKAKWKANTNTAYKVEHYKQGLDGKYTASPEVENLKGTTGASVKPSLKSYEGFVAPSAQTVTIKADGSLVVKYYYTRNSYKITWNLDGGKASGTYTSGTVKYGASITAPTVTKDGYSFDGWNTTVLSTMPAKDLTYTAKWKKEEQTQDELVTDFVKRFYKEVLGRSDKAIEEDEAGITDWANKLINKEKTGAQVAQGFVASKEFKNRGVSDEEYVTIMYVAFFGRDPDEGGYNGWLSKLKSGTSREAVLAGFTNSKEFQNLCAKYGIEPGKLDTNGQSQQNNNQQNNNNQSGMRPPLKLDSSGVDEAKLDDFVERLYKEVLGRDSDEGGKTYWTAAIMDGHDDRGNTYDAAIAIRKGFFESKEYLNKGRTDDEFLVDLYHAFFGRDPDEGGYTYWQNKMKNEGYSRQRVIDEGFGHSKEFKNLLTSYGFKIIE